VRVTRTIGPAVAKGNKSPQRPDWFVQWLKEQAKYVRLKCECVEDFSLPSCIELLTGKKIFLLCPNGHGFQPIVQKLKLRDYLQAKGFEIPEPPGLIPPY